MAAKQIPLILIVALLLGVSAPSVAVGQSTRSSAEDLREKTRERMEEMKRRAEERRKKREELRDNPEALQEHLEKDRDKQDIEDWAREADDQQGGEQEFAGEEDGGGESSDISPAQGIVEKKLNDLAHIKSEPPRDKTTYVRGRDGKPIVARVMRELGDKRMLKLPNGRLDFVANSATRPCDKPFRSMSRDAIVQEMKAEGFEDYTFEYDGYYIYAYKCSEGFYHHTRSILGTMLAGVVEQLREWGLKVDRPETPLVVVIFPDRASFDRHDPMDPGVGAYYSSLSNWVYLYEDTKLWDAAPEFAMKQYAYTVAHEGIHQVLHNTGIQQRLSKWPAWVSEGLPEYFCPLNVSSKIVRQGKSEMPERVLKWQGAGRVNDIRMWELLRGRTGGDGELVREAITYNNLTSYGYAISWGLTHYLGSRKSEQFAAYLRDLAKTPPLQANYEATKGAPDPLFVKHFGEDFQDVEADVKRHLTSSRMQKLYKDPIENQTVYVVKRVYIKRRVSYTTVVLTRSPEAARKWRDDERKRMEQMDEEAAFYTIICDNANEARYQITKLSR